VHCVTGYDLLPRETKQTESDNEILLHATTTMQANLRCKRAIIPHGSLDADVTVDKNLIPKPFHHYLTKLCKNLLDVSTVVDTSNSQQSPLTGLHLRHT
jgi:hypothetical protein